MSLYIVNGVGNRVTSNIGAFETRGEAEANIRQHIENAKQKIRGFVRFDKYDLYLRKVGESSTSEPVTTIYAS